MVAERAQPSRPAQTPCHSTGIAVSAPVAAGVSIGLGSGAGVSAGSVTGSLVGDASGTATDRLLSLSSPAEPQAARSRDRATAVRFTVPLP